MEDLKDAVRIGELDLRFLIDSDGATVFEFIVEPRARVPVPHYHAAADELVYGLEGVLTVTLGGERHLLHPGEAIFIPRGAVHHHANEHEMRSRTLVSITPGTIRKRYFEEIAAAAAGPGRPDPAVLREIMLRHGLVPA
ncbi:MAG: cupin domain-containing protein [Hyphomicrobiales bacterium]